MLRRFMNWLLHQLQRFLNLIGGQQSPARRVTPTQEKPESQDVGTAQREPYSAPADADTPTQSGISFSIESADPPVSRPSTPQQDAIQKVLSNAEGDTDTHMRLDAASSTVPGARSDLSDVENSADEARFFKGEASPTPSDNIQPVDQLPSIHDLLPAVEQEIKESAAQRSADDTPNSNTLTTEPIASLADSAPLPSQLSDITPPEPAPPEPELTEPLEPTESEQTASGLPQSENSSELDRALLFSFDITESTDDRAADVEIETRAELDAVTLVDNNDGELSDAENPSALVEDDIDAITDALKEADSPPEWSQKNDDPLSEADAEESACSEDNDVYQLASDLDTTQSENESKSELPSSDDSKSNAIDRASLPYPWSIATPKSLSNTEEEMVIQPEVSKPVDTSVNADSTTEPEPVQTSSADAVSNQPPQKEPLHTKNGVVKLLFTMKEGNFHGYIEPKDGTSDILFHQKYINEDIFDSLERGVEVVVSIKYMEGKAYATQVELAE